MSHQKSRLWSLLTLTQQKGVVNTVYGIPKNFFGLLGDFYDGFENGPRMIGSEVRQMGKVDGVLSGTYQGLAGVFAGLYDGVTGLYTEPKKGHQQEVCSSTGLPMFRMNVDIEQGIKGAFKGTGRGREFSPLALLPSRQRVESLD